MIVFAKKSTCQGDDYTIGCLLCYNYFKYYYKMIAIDLSKYQAFDVDLKGIQQINFIGNLESNAKIFFHMEELKESILNFSERTLKVLQFHFALI